MLQRGAQPFPALAQPRGPKFLWRGRHITETFPFPACPRGLPCLCPFQARVPTECCCLIYSSAPDHCGSPPFSLWACQNSEISTSSHPSSLPRCALQSPPCWSVPPLTEPPGSSCRTPPRSWPAWPIAIASNLRARSPSATRKCGPDRFCGCNVPPPPRANRQDERMHMKICGGVSVMMCGPRKWRELGFFFRQNPCSDRHNQSGAAG